MRLITLAFFIFTLTIVSAQKLVKLNFETKSYQQLKKNVETSFKDSSTLKDYLSELQLFAIKKGYLLASYDRIQMIDANHYTVQFVLGEKFQKAILTVDPEEIYFLRKNSNISEKVLAKIALTPSELSRTMSTMRNSYLNEGFPFANVQLEEITFDGTQLQASVIINRGDFYQWSEIHVRGDSSVSVKYISNLIGIKKGDAFNEKTLQSISKRIKQVNFIKEIKSSEVLFTQEGAELFVYVQSVPNSSVNGIIGLQPDPNSDRLSVTGEINLKLVNALKRGESLVIDWRAIQPQTQSLNAQLNIPFLFNTPFGIDGKFNLFKKDSTFLELKSTAGVHYFLKKGSYIKAFYQNNSSNLLSASQTTSANENFASVNSNNYGLAFYRKQLDYLPNPSRGLVFNIEGSAGVRKAQVADTSIIERSTIYRTSLDIEWYIPLTRRHVLKLKNGTNLYSAPVIYANELTRFGGFTTQRGFNEQELLANAQSTFTVEYRFLVDKNSHAFAFFDQTWYENNANKYVNDTPYGFGLGFSFGTNLGIFSISYALGKQFDNPILFRNGKIHFGYVAYF